MSKTERKLAGSVLKQSAGRSGSSGSKTVGKLAGSVLTQSASSKQQRAAFDKKLASDPKAAREFLQRAGILTKGGNLAKAYR